MNSTYKKAGFFRRFFAIFLDSLITLSFSTLVVGLGVLVLVEKLFGNSSGSAAVITGAMAFIVVLSSLLVFFYSWFFIYKYGGTLGKLTFGLRIVNEDGKYIDRATAFWRMTAGYSVSTGFMFLGYFWTFRKKENLTWHDRLFGTQVITVGKPFLGISWIVLLCILDLTVASYLISTLVSAFI